MTAQQLKTFWHALCDNKGADLKPAEVLRPGKTTY